MEPASRGVWVWDLYPLAPESWGPWQLEDLQEWPGGRVYYHRYGDDISRGPVKGRCYEDTRLHREAYKPSENDFELLRLLFPASDPYCPDWYQIEAALVAAGRVPAALPTMKAPVLLALLRKATQGQPAANADKAAEGPGERPMEIIDVPVGEGGAVADGGKDVPPSPDGPAKIGFAFWWEGKSAELEPIPFRLLRAVWNTPGRTVALDDIEDDVWGGDPKPNAPKNAVAKVNKAFSDVGCPRSMRFKQGTISLD